MLPYLPLSCEWLSYNFVDSDANSEESNHSINTKGNYLAIGSMKSFIDIWDLDIDGATEPFLTLRHPSGLKKSKLKGVLSLAWNRLSNNIFASGTAGGIVCLWDIETCTKLQEYPLHNDKVVCMRWHRFESNLLLTGGTDGIVNLIDCRVPSSLSLSSEATAPNYKNWDLGYPVDDIQWHDSDPFYFLAAANNGTVTCYDCRQNAKNTSVYQIDLLSSGDISSVGKASKKKISPKKKAKSSLDDSQNDQNEQSISMAIKYPRLYTCHSNENVVKIWDISNKASPNISLPTKPKFIGQKSIWSRGETGKCANRRIHALALLDDYDISPINTCSSTTGDFKQKKFDRLASGSQRHQLRDVVAFATIGTSKPFVKQFKTTLDFPDDAEQELPTEKTLLSAKSHKYPKNEEQIFLPEITRKLIGVDKLITKKNGKGSKKQKNEN